MANLLTCELNILINTSKFDLIVELKKKYNKIFKNEHFWNLIDYFNNRHYCI